MPTSALDASYNDDSPTIRVECAGGHGKDRWSLAYLDCQQHRQGSKWISEFLNRPKEAVRSPSNGETSPTERRRNHGKKTKGSFALVRSMPQDVVALGAYPPIFPLLEKAQSNPIYRQRFEGNYRRLADFAPLLMVSKASARFLGQHCTPRQSMYHTRSFRANVIVDDVRISADLSNTEPTLQPWAEESWAHMEISSPITNSSSSGSLKLHTIKPCPRCTVPCRDQAGTGQYLFNAPKHRFQLWTILHRLFPRQYKDPEWGSWAGAYMGIYVGLSRNVSLTRPRETSTTDDTSLTISVGDVITPTKTTPWDQHLSQQQESRDDLPTKMSRSGLVHGAAGIVTALTIGAVLPLLILALHN